MSEFDELLIPRPLPPEPQGLVAKLARDAATVQRRRRWIGRGRMVLIFAGIYFAGLATMWGWWHSREPQQATGSLTNRPLASESSSPGPTPEVTIKRFEQPERLEKRAFVAAGEKRVDLYRQAGDGFLLRDDVSSALRCYRKALDGGSAADLAIHTDRDTWLYMSLKVARQKEKTDARSN